MSSTRREFLKGFANTSAAALTAGCVSNYGFFKSTHGAPMQGFCAPKIPHIRLGVVGAGARGRAAVGRMCNLPGVTVTAICDIFPEKLARTQNKLAEHKKPKAKEYLGEEAWKRLCDDPDVDVVYNTTPWALHVPVQLGAMRAGKHVFTEVPSAFTVDECWELVETSEKTRRHCMQLENCCYGELEMFTFNLAKLGMLGELVHAEGAYIHNLCSMASLHAPDNEYWRFDENRLYGGNRYPTHGLVPLCLTFDINRGDRLDYLVSVDSNKANLQYHMQHTLKPDDPRRNAEMKMADMNSSLIKTARGKSFMIQHDVVSPRPYSRIQLVSGTKGIVSGYPFRMMLRNNPRDHRHNWFSDDEAMKLREKYRHPLWKTMQTLAKRVGGHGGMDFIMDARWVYCLQFGLPLDMDVYDLAATCCICELTEKSANNRGKSYDIPDFTRGAWRTAKPLGIVDINLNRMGIQDNTVKKDDTQMTV